MKKKNTKKFSEIFSVSTAFTFAFLFMLTIWLVYKYMPSYKDQIIADEIKKLNIIFQDINNNAGISHFDYLKNRIDFLNVEKFAGSKIGSMNLLHPEKWKGPYVQENPTINKKVYEIIKTKNGNFIVPAEGTILENGKIIGTDIIFDENSDIENMANDKNLLLSKFGPLAVKIGDKIKANSNENVLEPIINDESDVY